MRFWIVSMLVLPWVVLTAGCKMSMTQSASNAGNPQPSVDADRHNIDVPLAWGGEMRCSSLGCYLGVVEHETSKLALHRMHGRKSIFLDRQPLAYHPDSAIWLTDQLLVAAVEDSNSLDVFKVEHERLMRVQQIGIAFHPRDVIWLDSVGAEHSMLAVPYSGRQIAKVTWHEASSAAAKVEWAEWCASPWHPVKVSRAPSFTGAGIVVACLDDRKVIAIPKDRLLTRPVTLVNFQNIPRQARPSPSGKWLYVALEIGGKNARIDMDTGNVQMLDAHEAGSVSVVALSDDVVIWGGDQMLQIQRIDSEGNIMENRWLRTSGFSTGLQLLDVDQDGERDIVVFNSAGGGVDVLFGPLWEKANNKSTKNSAN